MESKGERAENHPILEKIDRLCAAFAEHAEALDRGGAANDLYRDNIAQLAGIGFFGAGVPEAFGGLGLPDLLRHECVERLSAACGVTAFGQNQLHTGGGFVSGGSEELRSRILPKMCTGEILCGVAFAHLRRAGGSPVKAKRASGGFVVSGTAPWISDWSILSAYVLGVQVADTNEMLFCYVDKAASAASTTAGESMQLAVMTAADTVSVDFHDLFIDDGSVLSRRDPENMKRSDRCAITSHVTLPLGCARGSIGYLRSLNRALTSEAAASFEDEVTRIRAASDEWSGSRVDEENYLDHALGARSGSISVALRAAEAAIAATGGRAHLLTHPAQRRLREAGFYATMALTPDTQTALLETFTIGC